MSLIVVDVESDAPCPGLGSIVCYGAVCLDDLSQTFYSEVKPITEKWNPEALSISGFSREQHENFTETPELSFYRFREWLQKVSVGRPVLISDNPQFDGQWINYYFHNFIGDNPFGFSARRIGDIYAGLTKNIWNANKWKHLRKTKHTHNPVDDAMGNAEALISFKKLGLKI